MDEEKKRLVGDVHTPGVLVKLQISPEVEKLEEVARLLAIYFRETLPWIDAEYRLLPASRFFLFSDWKRFLENKKYKISVELRRIEQESP